MTIYSILCLTALSSVGEKKLSIFQQFVINLEIKNLFKSEFIIILVKKSKYFWKNNLGGFIYIKKQLKYFGAI